MENKWLKEIPLRIGYYIAGFVDGEGSFNVCITKTSERRFGWKIEPIFNISQKDKALLALIKRWLKCGTLREKRDGVVYYEVRNIRALIERVIPFFDRFNFLSSNKKKNYSIFRRIVKKIDKGEHLTKKGIQEILKLREDLNKGRGRKRKYNIQDVIINN